MAWLWIIALVLPTIFCPTMGHMLVHTDENLADCINACIAGLQNHTLRISIEVENATIRRGFDGTVNRFLAKNDELLVDLASTESCSTFIRLYFVDSLKSFKTLVDRQYSQECASDGHQSFFVVLPSGVLIETLEEILNMCWKVYILNVNVLIEDENGTVNLYTYYPFTKLKCRDSTPTIHNRFINGSFQWNKEMFPPKMDNLWQCPVKAIVYEESPAILIDHNHIYGINGDILNTLATMMNFSIEVVMSPEGRGIIYPNNSMTGSFKLLKDGLGDILLGANGAERRKDLASTVPHFTGNLYAVVRRPRLYRSLDIIYLPFDWPTWLSLCTVLFAKWICQLLWRKYANRCIAVRYCSTRLHTMAWLFAMFIISSSYEGSIFRFLQHRPIKRIPQTIDEAAEHGYKFIVQPAFYLVLKRSLQMADHLVLNYDPMPDTLTSLTANEEKFAVIGADNQFSSYNMDPSMYEDYALIPKPIIMLNYCLKMQQYSFLTEAINTRIQRLVANGYMDRKVREYVLLDKLMKKGKRDEREIISLHHIKGAFILLAICTVVNIVVFTAELLSVRYPWLKRFLEVFY